ncbi:TPA: DNA gyrase subunit A [bacterium]|nr:DNA gyrase subunit A [bacterium]
MAEIVESYIENEMRASYLDYAMSVIVGRALPDVRDGLKPVHRRILYAMSELDLGAEKPYKKSARIVGEVLGKYHPHGDQAVYDALVRMAQDFSIRYPLVDGQGNFGSIDGDPPAAMRYTEVRSFPITQTLLQDIEDETVDFSPNFDESLKEPVVLPSVLPNLLVNGSSGIAVGMATNIPPHNLSEVISTIIATIDNPEITIDELMNIMPGPDFPTGGYIVGTSGIKSAYENGQGIIIIRGKAVIEKQETGRERIVITEIPYQVNKRNLIERIVELNKEKPLGVSELRDESSRDGIRIALEVKKDENPQVILNKLYKHTQLQTSFGIIFLAINEKQPEVMNLKRLIDLYIEHRNEVITKRSQYRLRITEDRLHILEGLKIAQKNIDEIIKIIRGAKDTKEARKAIITKFLLSEKQAQAILDMQLKALTRLEAGKIEKEYLELIKKAEYLKNLLSSHRKILEVIKDELLEINKKFGDERRTVIIPEEEEFRMEDLIKEEDVVITVSYFGYIKRIPVSVYKKQHRGGIGITGVELREEDFASRLFIVSTHDFLLITTNKGRLYWLKVYNIPEGGRISRGKPIINLIPVGSDEKISGVIPVREFKDGYIIMATRNGKIKKTAISEFSNPRQKGIIAMDVKDGDSLISCSLTSGEDEIVLSSKKGKALKFNEKDIRAMGRTASGVIGMRFDKGDFLVGMGVVKEGKSLLTITENGYGKRSNFSLYPLKKRGGRGVLDIKTDERNGDVVSILEVSDTDEIVVITSSGMVIRLSVSSIRQIGRNTKGVSIVRLKNNDKVVACDILVGE